MKRPELVELIYQQRTVLEALKAEMSSGWDGIWVLKVI